MYQQNEDEVRELLTMRPKETKSVRITSHVLEPQVHNQQRSVFHLNRDGILDNGSTLVVPVSVSNATTALPAYTGSKSLISRAKLSTSDGVTIIEQLDSNYLSTITNHYRTQEYKEKMAQLLDGSNGVFQYQTNAAGAIGGKEGLKGEQQGGTQNQYKRWRLSQDAQATSEYTVKLSSLFPSLFPYSIPVFLLSGYLILEITWAADGQTGERCVASDGNNANIGVCTIGNPTFVSDHLHYEEKDMNRLRSIASSSKGLLVPYSTFITNLITRTPPADPGAAENYTTQVTYRNEIGMSNLRIKYMFVLNSLAPADSLNTGAMKIAGKFTSMDTYYGRDSQSLQLIIDNNNYFPQNLSSNEFWTQLVDVFKGVSPSIPYGCYTAVGSIDDALLGMPGGAAIYTLQATCGLTDSTYNGEAQTALTGASNVIGVSFVASNENSGFNGKSVGATPISIRYVRNYTQGEVTPLQTRVFTNVERVMSIQNGKINNNFS